MRRLRSLGIARARALAFPDDDRRVPDTGVEVEVAGTTGTWRADPEALERLDAPFEGRTALLSPLDRLVFDRTRTGELLGFDYALEMYKPAARRRWGYFALPILHGDRLVGKLDAAVDRSAGELVVRAVHEDVRFDAALDDAVARQIDELAAWLQVDVRYS